MIGLLNFATCIGGLLSALFILSASVPPPVQHLGDELLMSPAAPEILACASSEEETEDRVVESPAPSCEDANERLAHSSDARSERLLLAYALVADDSMPGNYVLNDASDSYTRVVVPVARDGPIFAH